MANKKKITRDERIEIRLSKEEKELFYSFAKDCGINPARLARNLMMTQAENILNKPFYIPISKAYIKYLELTNQKQAIERLKEEN
jgi:uncharacterized protein (DUF1778 family)